MKIALLIFTVNFILSEVVAQDCNLELPHTTVSHRRGEYCYQFVHRELYWDSARDYCSKYGGHLVMIPDADTNEWIVDIINNLWWRNKGIWIGLHDLTKELTWTWVTDEQGTDLPMLWSNWARGHPGAFFHTRRDCVRMVRKDGWKWHETLCHTWNWKYRFICQYHSPIHNQQSKSEHFISGGGTSVNEDKIEKQENKNLESANKETTTDDYDDYYDQRLPVPLAQVGDESDVQSYSMWVILGISLSGVAFIVIVLILVIRHRRKKSQNDVIVQYIDTACKNRKSSHHPDSAPGGNTYVYCPTGRKGIHITENPYEEIPQNQDFYTNPEPANPDLSRVHDSVDKDIAGSLSSGYLTMTGSTKSVKDKPAESPESKDTMIQYDTPRPEPIYAEIPEQYYENR